MQIDIHYAAIYVLCRIVGMKSQYARIVAYSSQQVDDAIYGHALKFKQGGIFRQVMTAHEAISPDNLDVSDALEVWIPFHFLPKGLSSTGADEFITDPDSRVLDYLLQNIKETADSSLALYRLGIGVHSFADTFSHQDFKGFNDNYNDIKLLTAIDKSGIIKNLKEAPKRLVTELAPIGHAQALTNPDIPYAKWSYSRDNGKKIEVNNLEERFLPALQNLYDYLVDYISINAKFKSYEPVKGYEFYKDKFLKLLKYKGSIEKRYKNWLNHIQSNFFNFRDFDEIDKNIEYYEDKWFNKAVDTTKVSWWERLRYRMSNYHIYNKKSNFEDSNWVQFMRAAQEHKYIVYKILFDKVG